MNADASSYDVGSPAFVQKISEEYLSEGYDSLSELRHMTRVVALGVWVECSKVESFGCAMSVATESGLEDSATCETDLML